MRGAYDDLSNSLQSLMNEAREAYRHSMAQRLDEMSETGEYSWIYPYFVFIHRVRGAKLVKLILEYGKAHGFSPESGWMLESDVHTVAYANAVLWNKEWTHEKRNKVLSETECIVLWKNGTRREVPLLKITWNGQSFDAKLVKWNDIEQAVKTL